MAQFDRIAASMAFAPMRKDAVLLLKGPSLLKTLKGSLKFKSSTLLHFSRKPMQKFKSLTPFRASSSLAFESPRRLFSKSPSFTSSSGAKNKDPLEDVDDVVPSAGLARPLSEILKELNKKVPDSLLKVRVEDGFSMKYIPWHIANRIMNLHAPEWSGEIRSITYSSDGKSVTVVYRVTLYGTDAELHRESTGTAALEDNRYGNPVQKAEAMAFRRACARFGLGLHLYYEDSS